MAAIVWADVTGFAGELATGVSAGAQTLIIDYVNTTLKVCGFGAEDSPKVKLARILLAAHMATLTKRRGNAVGARTSQSSGGVSESFATLNLPDWAAMYAATSYGGLYAQLLSGSAFRAGLLLNKPSSGCSGC